MSLKQDFLDWKQHPVTKRVFDGLREQEVLVTDQLVNAAGLEPLEDRYRVGYIAALRDLYLIRLDDEGDAN